MADAYSGAMSPTSHTRLRESAGEVSPLRGLGCFAEPLRLLPVAFVWSIILGLYCIYTFLHLVPEMQNMSPDSSGATTQLVIFNLCTVMLWVCYLFCMLTHPGTTPTEDEDPSWQIVPMDPEAMESCVVDGIAACATETKSSKPGLRRTCKWCKTYKPDRAHHCRVCRQCILKMDHHCPWIYNCVGFKNHKYFFLLLVYSCLDTHIIAWTMPHSLFQAVNDPSTPFMTMFLLLFGETLAVLLSLLVTMFLGFHIWLMLNAMTTIDFCEPKKNAAATQLPYDKGIFGNVRAVLGDQPLLWLLPMSLPAGDGLSFHRGDHAPPAAARCSSGTSSSSQFPQAPKSYREATASHRAGQQRYPSPSPGTGEAPHFSGTEYDYGQSDNEAARSDRDHESPVDPAAAPLMTDPGASSFHNYGAAEDER